LRKTLRKQFLKKRLGIWVLESSSPFVRLAQPIETKREVWLRGVDLNHRPLGYEPNELPDCSTPHKNHNTLSCGGLNSHGSAPESVDPPPSDRASA
jgi:hypothetical protein